MSNAETKGSGDVVQFLLDQHAEIRRLFDQVRETPAGSRSETFQCLVRLLAVHETAEEMVVHPAARPAENGETVVKERLDEERKAKTALAALEKAGPDAPRFIEDLRAFETAVLEHADNEERLEFPLVRQAQDEQMLQRMRTAFIAAEATAPTHPHPHGPDGAIGNLLVGPFASIVDRVRDALKPGP